MIDLLTKVVASLVGAVLLGVALALWLLDATALPGLGWPEHALLALGGLVCALYGVLCLHAVPDPS